MLEYLVNYWGKIRRCSLVEASVSLRMGNKNLFLAARKSLSSRLPSDHGAELSTPYSASCLSAFCHDSGYNGKKLNCNGSNQTHLWCKPEAWLTVLVWLYTSLQHLTTCLCGIPLRPRLSLSLQSTCKVIILSVKTAGFS